MATHNDAGTTRPAGEGISDDEAVAEVAQQTSSDLKSEGVFERDSDGTASDQAVANLDADQAD